MDRGLTADDVARALWRRPWVVLAVSGLVLVLGAAYVLTRPRVWKATSVVRVEPQQTDAQLVQRTVGDVEPRLLSLRQAMLGGPVLSKVVDQLKLYPDLVARRGKEAAIEQLREAIDVKPTWNAFEVTVAPGARRPRRTSPTSCPPSSASSPTRPAPRRPPTPPRVFDAQVKELQATGQRLAAEDHRLQGGARRRAPRADGGQHAPAGSPLGRGPGPHRAAPGRGCAPQRPGAAPQRRGHRGGPGPDGRRPARAAARRGEDAVHR